MKQALFKPTLEKQTTWQGVNFSIMIYGTRFVQKKLLEVAPKQDINVF